MRMILVDSLPFRLGLFADYQKGANWMISKYFKVVFWALLSLLAAIATANAAELPPFQALPLTLRADQVLPRELLAGPNYRIEPDVLNDGFINIYQLQTDYGPLIVEGTDLLMERLQELAALEAMEAVKKTDVFKEAFKSGAKAPLQTAKGMVTAPIETTKGIVSGVGKWFSDVGRAVVSDDPHQEGVLKTAAGHAPAKRAFAYEFKVNPYSDYPPLQEALNDMAWAATGGGLTPKVAFAAIGGTAGTVLQATGTAEGMRKLVRDYSPAELEKINKEKLSKLSVSAAAAEALLKNPHYDPQEETFLVGALEQMADVDGLDTLVTIAGKVEDPNLARFMRLRTELLAGYARKTPGANKLVELNGLLSLLQKDGTVVALVPLDYLVWTKALQDKETLVSESIAKNEAIRAKELWISGAFHPSARSALEELDWKLKEGAQKKVD
jgi:hypothetical protein